MTHHTDKPVIPGPREGRPPLPAGTRERIERLKTRSGRGLYAIALFIAVSICAVRDFDFLPSFSPAVRAMLGRPPTANMISMLLLFYSFFSIILILARMTGGSSASSGFSHVGFLTGFFAFYHFAGAMDDNFWAVFAAGMTILGLDGYHLWTYCTEEIRKELENVPRTDRNVEG